MAACNEKLDKAMMLSLVISSGDPPQQRLPEIPGLSKETVDDPAFIVHIQPEVSSGMYYIVLFIQMIL